MRSKDHKEKAPGQSGLVSRRDALRITGGTAIGVAGVAGLSAGPADATEQPAKSSASPPAGERRRSAESTRVDHAGASVRSTGVPSTQLLIRDGTPAWWMSPDIWVVPGNDPNGAPGSPIAGDIAYVWARVTNTGSSDAVGVPVTFYWGNPAVQMYFSSINLIGTSYADIPAGGSQDVLCLVPWQVVTVNNGHECLVVTATGLDSPPLPDAINPPADSNVAQRNLTVLPGLANNRDFYTTVTVHAPPRQAKLVQVSSELGGELPEKVLASLGLKQTKPASKDLVAVGFSREPITDPEKGIGEPGLEIEVPAGRSVPIYVTVRATGAELGGEEYQLVNVIERDQEEVLGGISFVAILEGGPER